MRFRQYIKTSPFGNYFSGTNFDFRKISFLNIKIYILTKYDHLIIVLVKQTMIKNIVSNLLLLIIYQNTTIVLKSFKNISYLIY